MRHIYFLVAASLALYACGNKEEKEASAKITASPMALKPGLWETRAAFTNIEANGLNENQKKDLMEDVARKLSGDRCISPQQVEHLNADFFGGGYAKDCKYKTFRAQGGKLEIAVSCSVKSMASYDMELSGSAGGTKFSTDTTTILRLPIVGEVLLHGAFEGSYKGPCEKSG